jgi:hypothetical protein
MMRVAKINTTLQKLVGSHDHTLPDDPLGRFYVNVVQLVLVVSYSKPIRECKSPNQPVIISLWAQKFN